MRSGGRRRELWNRKSGRAFRFLKSPSNPLLPAGPSPLFWEIFDTALLLLFFFPGGRHLGRGFVPPAKRPPPPPPPGPQGRPARPGDLRRGNHGVRPRQRAPCPSLPGPDQADDHRQHHVPRRLPQRELRRDGHGASARAPDVQGDAEASEHPAGADVPRRPPERHDLVRPHELLRDLPGDRREPALGARPRGRPDGPLLHREEGPRQRDDGRSQRVRARRERPGERSRGARSLDRLSLAQLRPLDDRRARGHRERADRAAPGFLANLLPARQRVAARRRQVRRGEDARPDRPDLLRRSRARPASFSAPTRRSRRRTASAK